MFAAMVLSAFLAFALAFAVGKDFEHIQDIRAALTSELQLGIDLGTTQSVAAICVQGNVSVIQVDAAELVPSTVWFSHLRGIHVGKKAIHARIVDPGNVIYAAKRVIGLAYPDVVNGIRISAPDQDEKDAHHASSVEMMQSLPFSFVNVTEKGPWEGNIGFRLANEGRVVTPEHVSALVLKRLKTASEKSPMLDWFRRTLGFSFKSLTVSVPITFTDEQKKATVRASKMAGFKQVRLIEEPVAAAIAYGLNRERNTSRVLVFDIGGGTLDVAILNFNAYSDTFYVETTAGEPKLGGEDFDVIVAEIVLQKLNETTAAERVRARPELFQELLIFAERAKRDLSSFNTTDLCVPEVEESEKTIKSKNSTDQLCQVRVEITRSEFRHAAAQKFKLAIDTVQRALDDADIANDTPLDVVLVGGSSRIPGFRKDIQALLPKATLFFDNVDPDKAVAIGAAKSWGCNQ